MSRFYWYIAVDGDMDGLTEGDSGYYNFEEAVQAAEEKWAETVGDYYSLKNGDLYEDTATAYLLDSEEEDEDGDDKIIHSLDVDLYYEHYHGDLAEHGLTMRDVL